MASNTYSISVIIPTYNRAHLVRRAITSVLSQLEDDDELIVVDDGSKDNTEEIVSEFAKKVHYIKINHGGAGVARNHGISKARNPLIGFLDSDDEWLPGKLTIQREFIKIIPEILFCFSNCSWKSRKGEIHRFTLNTWHNDNRTWEEILGPGHFISSLLDLPKGISDFKYHIGEIYLSSLLYGNYLNVNTMIVKRKDAGDALHFAEDISIYEEMECLARLARKGKCAYLDCETILQHAHYGDRLTDAGSLERIEAQLVLIKRIWGNDKEFLKLNNHFYRRAIHERQLSKVGTLILMGNTMEAKAFIQEMESCPIPHRILSCLPGRFAGPLAQGLRRIKYYLNKIRSNI